MKQVLPKLPSPVARFLLWVAGRRESWSSRDGDAPSSSDVSRSGLLGRLANANSRSALALSKSVPYGTIALTGGNDGGMSENPLT